MIHGSQFPIYVGFIFSYQSLFRVYQGWMLILWLVKDDVRLSQVESRNRLAMFPSEIDAM